MIILRTVFGWLTSALSAISSWYTSISVAVGFDLWGFMIGITMLGIVLAYLVLPAYGGSDKSQKSNKKDD